MKIKLARIPYVPINHSGIVLEIGDPGLFPNV